MSNYIYSAVDGFVYRLDATTLRLDGWKIEPFPGFRGALCVVQDEEHLYVSPWTGGGPVAKKFRKTDGSVVVWDTQVGGDLGSRTGAFLTPPLPRREVTALTAGDSAGYPIYLDFGTRATTMLPDNSWVKRVVERVARYLAPLPVKVTTAYQTGVRPGEYTTVQFLPTAGVTWKGSGPQGHVPQKQVRNQELSSPCVAYVGYRADAEAAAALAAHEAVHTIQPDGMNHEDTPGNLMRSDAQIVGGVLSANMVAAIKETLVRIRQGWRLIAHPGPNNQYTIDWVQLI